MTLAPLDEISRSGESLAILPSRVNLKAVANVVDRKVTYTARKTERTDESGPRRTSKPRQHAIAEVPRYSPLTGLIPNARGFSGLQSITDPAILPAISTASVVDVAIVTTS
jgi:hypothetical protein